MDLNAFFQWKWNEIMRKQCKFHKTQDSECQPHVSSAAMFNLSHKIAFVCFNAGISEEKKKTNNKSKHCYAKCNCAMTCSECMQRLYYLYTLVPTTDHQHQKWYCQRKKDALQTCTSYYCFSISVMDLNAFLKWKWNEIMRKQCKFHKTQDSECQPHVSSAPMFNLSHKIAFVCFNAAISEEKKKTNNKSKHCYAK